MPDSIHPNNRPLTIPEMFRRLAVMAENTDDYTTLLPGISHVETEVRLAIDGKRPGWWLDQLLGTSSKEHAHG